MLSIKMIANSAVASHYYSEADYYSPDQQDDSLSLWEGEGAKKLNLKGAVGKEAFKQLLDGDLPDGTHVGQPKSNDTKAHKKGWDFTLSAPKSVSILALTGGDKRLIAAHSQAVNTALKHLESNYSVTRQQINGEIRDVLTGNLVTASFTHTTSRSMDPQLHTHNVIMNLTKRPDGQWRSLESRRMYEASMKIGQVYRSELAANVKALGYDISVNSKLGTFDISSVPNEVVKGFSTRREAILEAAKKYGYRTAKGMDNAAVRTREAKQTSNQTALNNAWSEQLRAFDYKPEKDINSALSRVKNGDIQPPSDSKVAADLEFARTHLSEREAVFKRDEIEMQALRSGLGGSRIGSVERAIEKEISDGKLVPATIRHGRQQLPAYTTPEAIRKEHYIIDLMRRGKGEVSAIAGRRAIAALIDDRGFTKGQAAAVRTLLSSKDRVAGIQGWAGTGKTYMLSAFREMAEENGFTVAGLAPTATAANHLQEETGIESSTLASHLMRLHNDSKTKQKKTPKHILVVDESSLENTQDAADLLTFSRKTHSRVYLIGDRQQMGAIEAGKPFDQLLRAGMQFAEMRDIMRQKDSPTLKAAVEAAIEHQPAASLNHISETVHSMKDEKERIAAMVARVMALPESERHATLVLIPDNKTRTTINNLIREGLQQKDIVDKSDYAVTGLNNRYLTRAEKGRAQFYNEGDVVVFGKPVKSIGVAADVPYSVIKPGDQQLTLRGDDGKAISWDPSKVAGRAKYGAEVYEQERRKIAVGDEINWRRKDTTLEINNKEFGKVMAIDHGTGDVKIAFKESGEKTVNLKQNKHWEHAYATTVYSGQGATYNEAIVHAESWRRNLVNQKSFYVALSRARFKSHIYTDDAAELAKKIGQRPGEKTSALEGVTIDVSKLLDENGVPKDFRDPSERGPTKGMSQRILDKLRGKQDKEFEL